MRSGLRGRALDGDCPSDHAGDCDGDRDDEGLEIDPSGVELVLELYQMIFLEIMVIGHSEFLVDCFIRNGFRVQSLKMRQTLEK